MRAASRLRISDGATALGTQELGPFTVPNPGGGADLIEDVSLVLVPGHRYGLIGRNGKGKSTLLKLLASRRVGGLDASLSVHYVSQEVSLNAGSEKQPYGTFRLSSHHCDRFELDLRGYTHMRGAAFSCLRL